MSANEEKPIFHFLSASQVLELNEFRSRQSLIVTPQPRHVSDDDALAYVFVSHRWTEPGNPDSDGKQLAALKKWLRYVNDLLQATVVQGGGDGDDDDDDDATLSSWPENLKELVEGMPQATSLVSRMSLRSKYQTVDPKFLKHPMDHIWIWYDCACLPQKFPNERTQEEVQEFCLALQNLDQLAQQCEVVCLESEDYFGRAWCAFEHFQKSLDHFEGHITIDCDRVIQEQRVEWMVDIEEGEQQGGDAEQQDVHAKVRHAMAESRKAEYEGKQSDWDAMHQEIAPTARRRRKEEEEAKQKQQQQEDAAPAPKTEDVYPRKHRERMPFLRQLFPGCFPGSHDTAAVVSATEPPEPKKPRQEPIRRRPIGVPDMGKAILRIRNSRSTMPQSPPLLKAMTALVRELFTAVFTMSCRDAAKLSKDSSAVAIPPDFNECVPRVGIQCGLHDHRLARPLKQQSEALQHCISTCWKSLPFPQGPPCPNGHSLRPGVTSIPLGCDGCQEPIQPGEVHAGCLTCDYDICSFCATGQEKSSSTVDPSSQECLDKLLAVCQKPSSSADEHQSMTFCERRVTVNLFQLAHSILARAGLKCTNSGDVAFVGLLALRNILSTDSRRKEQERGRRALRISAGSLRFLAPVFDEAVSLYSNLLANDSQVTELNATITFKVPRWVLLDMACARLDVNTSLAVQDSFTLGQSAHKYLEEHPDCISVDFDSNDRTPVGHRFCQEEPDCLGGWAPCAHNAQDGLLMTIGSVQAPATLDPWSRTRDLPTTLACFSCVVAEDRVYVIGGAPGDEDPETRAFTTCLGSVYSAQLPLSTSTAWQRMDAELSVPRRSHAGCVRKDNSGKAATLLIGGGRESTIDGREAQMVSSIEALQLSNSTGTDSTWEKVLEMPRPRTSHHMVSIGEYLFVFGGRTEPNVSDSRICDIYDFRAREWKEGPRHSLVIGGGSMVLIANRFVWVFGGVVEDVGPSQSSWVLDLKPWLAWLSSGSQSDHPRTAWFKGPGLPQAMTNPNVCLAAQEETGLDTDWLLLVGSVDCGNFSCGVPLPSALREEHATWTRQGIQAGNETLQLSEWTRMGSTPDGSAFGGLFVHRGVLAMVAGVSMSQFAPCNAVHFRQLPSPNSGFGTVLPAGRVDPNSGGLDEMLGRIGKNSTAYQQILLNDQQLVGRLGFPIPEGDLFANDGTKKLAVVHPEELHCHRCLTKTQSLDLARKHNDTALFAIRPQEQVVDGVNHRAVHLCSECLCCLYFDSMKLSHRQRAQHTD